MSTKASGRAAGARALLSAAGLLILLGTTGAALAGPSGLDVRPVNRTCLAGAAPGSGAVQLQPVWPELSPYKPFDVRPTPGTAGEYYVIARDGMLYRFVPGAAPVAALDLRGEVGVNSVYNAYTEGGSEHYGLISLAFDPLFAQNRRIYVLTNGRKSGEAFTTSIVSRYTVRADGSVDPSTRLVILALPQANGFLHHLGHIAFGPDGHLYVSSGDSTPNGWSPDAPPPGQVLSSLSGKMLRLDVRNATTAQPYAIPADNPSWGAADARPEVYAIGLRNPWRFSFDPPTGKLWLGDVGYASWEEVNLVEKGRNYGWPILEANACVHAGYCSTPTPSTPPLIEINHGGNYMGVIGGHVYRGSALASTLAGKYIFGLYGPDSLYTIDPSQQNRLELLLDGTPELTAFFLDDSGEFYAVASWEGNVYKLVRGAGAGDEGIPQLLSQTGCVQPANPRVARGMIPFEVRAQLWSDGANKKRWVALPDGARIGVDGDGDFAFPDGAVLMKTFMFNGVPFETRFLKRHDGGRWAGYTYRWEGNDARLVDAAGQNVTVTNNLGQRINWRYPSRGECMLCHTEGAGFALGPELAQLNFPITYPQTGRTANQLDTWEHVGLFDAPLPFARPALVNPTDTSQPLPARARSYLHANCAGCHQPENPLRATIDLQHFTPTPQMQLCNQDPRISTLGIAGAKLLYPQRPDLSVLPQRMRRRGENQMPPLGTQLVHAQGVTLIENWIRRKDVCN